MKKPVPRRQRDLVGVQHVGLLHPTKLEEHPKATVARAKGACVGNSARYDIFVHGWTRPLVVGEAQFSTRPPTDAFSSSSAGIGRNDADDRANNNVAINE